MEKVKRHPRNRTGIYQLKIKTRKFQIHKIGDFWVPFELVAVPNLSRTGKPILTERKTLTKATPMNAHFVRLQKCHNWILKTQF